MGHAAAAGLVQSVTVVAVRVRGEGKGRVERVGVEIVERIGGVEGRQVVALGDRGEGLGSGGVLRDLLDRHDRVRSHAEDGAR